MDIHLQRLVDRWCGVPLCGALSAWHAGQRALGVVPPPDERPLLRRVLVILLSEMGSLVLAEPMFRRLRERHPGVEIHAMVFRKNRSVLDLLRVVDPAHVITLRDGSPAQLAGDLLRAVGIMRSQRFDAVVDCELFARISAILSGLSGARHRAGFHRATQEGLYRGSFMTAPVPYNPYRHLSHQLIALVESIGTPTTPPNKNAPITERFDPPVFQPEAGEVEREVAQLHRDHPACEGRSLVLMYPSGGLLPIRAWPLEHYAAIARALLADGHAVGIIGMPEDRLLADDLRRACDFLPGIVNLAGETRSVRHLMCLFHRAKLLITNDGGPVQFAAMTPIHALVMYGPETPLLYSSWSPRMRAFWQPIACSPCVTAYNHRNSPCDGDNQCLKRIAPDAVLAAAREALAAASHTA